MSKQISDLVLIYVYSYRNLYSDIHKFMLDLVKLIADT